MPVPIVWDLYEGLIEIQERRAYHDTPYPYEIIRMRVRIPDSFDLNEEGFPQFIRLRLRGEEKRLRVMDWTLFNDMQPIPIHYGLQQQSEMIAGPSRIYMDITGIVENEMGGVIGESPIAEAAEAPTAEEIVDGYGDLVIREADESASRQDGWTDIREEELEELRKRTLPGYSNPQQGDKLKIGEFEYIFDGEAWILQEKVAKSEHKKKKNLYSRKLRIRRK